MTAPTIAEYLKFANLQMAAEALFDADATLNLPLEPRKPCSGALLVSNLTTGSHPKRWMPIAGMALLLASLLTTGCADRLTPDQVMIDNFQKNKPAFEELVTSYLQFPPPNNGEWDQLPRVKELKQATGVKSITDSSNIWFDDPYSLESAQKLHDIDQKGSWRQYHDRSNAIISMPTDKGYRNNTLYWGNSSKDYFYYPADPKVENGRIVPPRQLDGRTYPGMRVLDSLNAAPGGSECYLRRIEPKWFIQRCDIR